MAEIGLIARLMRVFGTDRSLDPDSGGNTDDPRYKAPTSIDDDDGYVGGDDPQSLYKYVSEQLQQEQSRVGLYKTYEQMDTTDVIAGILDMYAESATPQNPDTHRTVWVDNPGNRRMEDHGNQLLHRLDVEGEITAFARELAKYGDLFERLVYAQGEGVLASHPVKPHVMHRKEDKIHKLLGFHQDGKKFRRRTSTLSYPWDYVHWRLRGRNRDGVYGTSILYNMIRPWRQLLMAEDHALVYEISRTPDRVLYMIDVGQSDEAQAKRIVREVRRNLSITSYIDPKGKDMDYRYNPPTPIEDQYIGIRPNSQTRIEKFPGSPPLRGVDSMLQYFISKLFSAARTPKTAFGFEGRYEYNTKAQLTNQDIKYARNARRLQRALKSGFRTLLEIDFIISMEDPEQDAYLDYRRKGNNFKVEMAPVSWLEELERLELQQLRYQVADQMMATSLNNSSFNSRNWTAFILKKYVRLSDSEIRRVLVAQKTAKNREGVMFGDPDALAKQQAAMGVSPQESELPGEGPIDWTLVDGNVSNEESRIINEVVNKSADIQRLINYGRQIFETERPELYVPAEVPDLADFDDLSDDVDESDIGDGDGQYVIIEKEVEDA